MAAKIDDLNASGPPLYLSALCLGEPLSRGPHLLPYPSNRSAEAPDVQGETRLSQSSADPSNDSSSVGTVDSSDRRTSSSQSSVVNEPASPVRPGTIKGGHSAEGLARHQLEPVITPIQRPRSPRREPQRHARSPPLPHSRSEPPPSTSSPGSTERLRARRTPSSSGSGIMGLVRSLSLKPSSPSTADTLKKARSRGKGVREPVPRPIEPPKRPETSTRLPRGSTSGRHSRSASDSHSRSVARGPLPAPTSWYDLNEPRYERYAQARSFRDDPEVRTIGSVDSETDGHFW